MAPLCSPHKFGGLLLIAVLAGCAPGAAESADGPPARSTPPPNDSAATPDVEEAGAALKTWAAALADGDMAAALEGAAGPVAAWLRHADVVARARGDVPFERVNTTQATEDPRVEGDAVVFGGPLVYGPENPPPPPRVLTDLELVPRNDGWRVSSLHRDDIPIERYVSGGTEAGAVSSDGVTGRVLAVFHDASCSADPDCPSEGAELVSVAIALDNATDSPLAPSEFWLETSQGRVDPVDAGATDFPPGGSGVGFAAFPALGQLSEGGTLQLRLDAGGTPVELALPVPAFSPS